MGSFMIIVLSVTPIRDLLGYAVDQEVRTIKKNIIISYLCTNNFVYYIDMIIRPYPPHVEGNTLSSPTAPTLDSIVF